MLELWSTSLRDAKDQIRSVFAASRVARSARAFLDGAEPRKTGWMRAEGRRRSRTVASAGGARAQPSGPPWDADALRDAVRGHVVETLAEPAAILVLDEIGFLEQGKASCGALYLPKAWTDDPDRRAATPVPETLAFATKPQMALAMIRRAIASRRFNSWIDERPASANLLDRQARRSWHDRGDCARCTPQPRSRTCAHGEPLLGTGGGFVPVAHRLRGLWRTKLFREPRRRMPPWIASFSLDGLSPALCHPEIVGVQGALELPLPADAEAHLPLGAALALEQLEALLGDVARGSQGAALPGYCGADDCARSALESCLPPSKPLRAQGNFLSCARKYCRSGARTRQ